MEATSRPLVGAKVQLVESGRIGKLLVDDNGDIPFKVSFSDGLSPEADWFKEDMIRLIQQPEFERSQAEVVCPICLSSSDGAQVITPCNHRFCKACIEHAFAVLRPEDPTQAPCPMCRRRVTLFELRVSTTGDALHHRDDDLSALVGCVFIDRRMPQVGLASYHFEDAGTAYVSYESYPEGHVLDDDSPMPRRKAFQEACWHSATRTFHGVLDWSPSSYDGASRWEFVMQFSTDLRYLCGGSIAKVLPENACAMDGAWRVEWEDGNAAEIMIERGAWELWGSYYRLDLSDPRRPRFTWRGLGVLQQCEIDPEESRREACRVVWTTNHPSYPTIAWVRLQSGPTDSQPVEIVPFGPRGLSYVRYLDLPAPEIRYHPGAPHGNCFMQGLRTGMASYHFEALGADGVTNAYISYEHPDCAQWPPLDNGAPVPARMSFTETEWTPEDRCFRGHIDWQRVHQTTWHGTALWIYEMVFDPNFLYIRAGQVRTFLADGSEEPEREWQHFGDQLVYINAAAADAFRENRELQQVLDLPEVPMSIRRQLAQTR